MKNEVSFISVGIPILPKPDLPPQVLIQDSPVLVVVRNGNTELHKISKTVAAELIAAGFSYEG